MAIEDVVGHAPDEQRAKQRVRELMRGKHLRWTTLPDGTSTAHDGDCQVARVYPGTYLNAYWVPTR